MKSSKPYWRHKRPEKPPEPEPQSEIFQKYLSNPAFVIACVTALLYFHGQAIYFGSLSYWGLSPDLFPQSLEKMLVTGAQVYLLLGIDHCWYLAILGLITVVMYLTVFLLLSKKSIPYLFRVMRTQRISKPQKMLLSEALDRLSAIGAVVFLFLLIILVMALAYIKGQSLAEIRHQKIKAEKEKTVAVNYLDEKSEPAKVTGSLIQSSSLMIALFRKDDKLQVIPVSRVISIQGQIPD